MSSPSDNDLKRYHFSTIVNFYYDLNEIKEIYNCQVWNRKDILGTARNSLEEQYLLNPLISLNYLWSCSVVSLFLGLWVYSNNEKRLLTR